MENRNRLDLIEESDLVNDNDDLEGEDHDEEGTGLFRKDTNTFPRICNILFSNEDALMRNSLL